MLPDTRFDEITLPVTFTVPAVLFGIVTDNTALQLLPVIVLRSTEND
jgi:hypothetical protein